MIKVILPTGKVIFFQTNLELHTFQELQDECSISKCKIRVVNPPKHDKFSLKSILPKIPMPRYKKTSWAWKP
jgi:hypothetical protein